MARCLRNYFLQLLPYIGLIIFTTLFQVSSQQTGIHATGYPVDTSVFVGETVTFTCTVVEAATQNQIIDWYIEWDDDSVLRDTFAQIDASISTSSRPEFTDRGLYSTQYTYSTHPDDTKIHYCTLTINHVIHRDSGYFGCTHQINPDDTHRTLLKEKIRLDIFASQADPPHCTITSEDAASGVLNCESVGGDPAAMVTWYNNAGMTLGDPKTIVSSIKIYKTSAYQEFICLARQVTLSPTSCNVFLMPLNEATITEVTTTKRTTSRTTKKEPTNLSTRATSPKIVHGTATNNTVLTQTPTTETKLAVGRPTKATHDKENTSFIPIIGAIAGALLLFVIILLLLCLLLGRKKKKTQENQNNNEVELADETDQVAVPPPPERTTSRQLPQGCPPTLPTLEPPTKSVEENPYGILPGPSTPKPDHSDSDDGPDLQKPWKNNPEWMASENDGFDSDEAVSDY